MQGHIRLNRLEEMVAEPLRHCGCGHLFHFLSADFSEAQNAEWKNKTFSFEPPHAIQWKTQMETWNAKRSGWFTKKKSPKMLLLTNSYLRIASLYFTLRLRFASAAGWTIKQFRWRFLTALLFSSIQFRIMQHSSLFIDLFRSVGGILLVFKWQTCPFLPPSLQLGVL